MAYVTPTPAEFKTRYPIFDAVADVAVFDAITEGEGKTDDSWVDADRRPAVMLYAAHILILDGQGSSTEAQLQREGMADFQQIRSNGLHLQRFDAAGTATGLKATSFGKRFAELLRVNRGGPRGVRGCRPYSRHPAAQDF